MLTKDLKSTGSMPYGRCSLFIFLFLKQAMLFWCQSIVLRILIFNLKFALPILDVEKGLRLWPWHVKVQLIGRLLIAISVSQHVLLYYELSGSSVHSGAFTALSSRLRWFRNLSTSTCVDWFEWKMRYQMVMALRPSHLLLFRSLSSCHSCLLLTFLSSYHR